MDNKTNVNESDLDDLLEQDKKDSALRYMSHLMHKVSDPTFY